MIFDVRERGKRKREKERDQLLFYTLVTALTGRIMEVLKTSVG